MPRRVPGQLRQLQRHQRPDGSHALSLADGGATLRDRFFAQSSFGTFAIAHEANTVKVRDDAPLDLLGPLGCGIQTGAGTVLRALRVGAGATFAVTGAGAVGLSAAMAARAAGATAIIAVDVVPTPLDFARELGATSRDQREGDRCRRRDPAGAHERLRQQHVPVGERIGREVWVKYHFKTEQGIQNMTDAEARAVRAALRSARSTTT